MRTDSLGRVGFFFALLALLAFFKAVVDFFFLEEALACVFPVDVLRLNDAAFFVFLLEAVFLIVFLVDFFALTFRLTLAANFFLVTAFLAVDLRLVDVEARLDFLTFLDVRALVLRTVFFLVVRRLAAEVFFTFLAKPCTSQVSRLSSCDEA